MILRQLQVGDEIEANVRGQHFKAIVEVLDDDVIPGRPVRVKPLSRNITWFHLSARQIVRRLHRGPRQMEIAT